MFFSELLLVFLPGVVVHACNNGIQEAEVGQSEVRGQPWLYSDFETLPVKQGKKLGRSLFVIED